MALTAVTAVSCTPNLDGIYADASGIAVIVNASGSQKTIEYIVSRRSEVARSIATVTQEKDVLTGAIAGELQSKPISIKKTESGVHVVYSGTEFDLPAVTPLPPPPPMTPVVLKPLLLASLTEELESCMNQENTCGGEMTEERKAFLRHWVSQATIEISDIAPVSSSPFTMLIVTGTLNVPPTATAGLEVAAVQKSIVFVVESFDFVGASGKPAVTPYQFDGAGGRNRTRGQTVGWRIGDLLFAKGGFLEARGIVRPVKPALQAK